MRRTHTDDAAVLKLALRWAPYGEIPTGEIWVTFGMSPDRFYTTLAQTMASVMARELSAEQRQSLERLVRRHIRPQVATRSVAATRKPRSHTPISQDTRVLSWNV